MENERIWKQTKSRLLQIVHSPFIMSESDEND